MPVDGSEDAILQSDDIAFKAGKFLSTNHLAQLFQWEITAILVFHHNLYPGKQ